LPTDRLRLPDDYVPLVATERPLRAESDVVVEADPAQPLSVIVVLRRHADQAALDRFADHVLDQGLQVLGTRLKDRCVIITGTVSQMCELFVVAINDYGSSEGRQLGFHGPLHLPGWLATDVENVVGLVEHEITQIETLIGRIRGEPGTDPGEPVHIFDLVVHKSGPTGPVNTDEFSQVQLFDVGWLMDPGVQRMLDNFGASPGAVTTVRVMKVFTCGTLENGIEGTASGGTVWPAGVPASEIDFTTTMEALGQLNSRGLIPFIVLGFFPDGIYTGTSYANPAPSVPLGPVAPDDADWSQIRSNWQTLVQTFFTELIAKFTAQTVATWWFEVWNEPDISWGPDEDAVTGDPPTFPLYQDLYLATSEIVVSNGWTETVRLGGPTITALNIVDTDSETPATLMSAFIEFVAGTAGIQCQFISFHAKGGWDPQDASSLDLVVASGDQVAWLAQHAGLNSVSIVNDEADMRAYFAVPFLPNMTAQFPAWLTAVTIAYDSLSSQYAPLRVRAASDDAELPLVGQTESGTTGAVSFAQASFGEQRSIMTAASGGETWPADACPTDLIKVPVYGFYELLRLLGDEHGTFLTGSGNYYPNGASDLFHMITVASTHIGSVFCVYPPNAQNSTALSTKSPWNLSYSIVNLPWETINWYQFQIDAKLSNGYAAAGGPPTPAATSLALNGLPVEQIRAAQELSVANHGVGVAATARTFSTALELPTFTTSVIWITEWSKTDAPSQPQWAADAATKYNASYGTDVVLRWNPDPDPNLYTFEVYRDEQTNLVSPVPLRSAMWIDTAVGTDVESHTYWIRAVSASNNASPFSTPQTVPV